MRKRERGRGKAGERGRVGERAIVEEREKERETEGKKRERESGRRRGEREGYIKREIEWERKRGMNVYAGMCVQRRYKAYTFT